MNYLLPTLDLRNVSSATVYNMYVYIYADVQALYIETPSSALEPVGWAWAQQTLKPARTGMLECWNAGMLECWNTRTSE